MLHALLISGSVKDNSLILPAASRDAPLAPVIEVCAGLLKELGSNPALSPPGCLLHTASGLKLLLLVGTGVSSELYLPRNRSLLMAKSAIAATCLYLLQRGCKLNWPLAHPRESAQDEGKWLPWQLQAGGDRQRKQGCQDGHPPPHPNGESTCPVHSIPGERTSTHALALPCWQLGDFPPNES